MPLIHRALTNGLPIISVIVSISEPRRTALAAASLATPSPILLNLLIDTGASCVVLDQVAIAPLGLVPTGVALMHTPSTTSTVPHSCKQYDISLIIPAVKGTPFVIAALPALEGSFRHQGFDGLLGRDVLENCVLFYNSPVGGYTLAF